MTQKQGKGLYASSFQQWSQKLNNKLNGSSLQNNFQEQTKYTYKNLCDSQLNLIKQKVLSVQHQESLNKPQEIHITIKELDQLLKLREKERTSQHCNSPKSQMLVHKINTLQNDNQQFYKNTSDENNNYTTIENIQNNSYQCKQNFKLNRSDLNIKEQTNNNNITNNNYNNANQTLILPSIISNESNNLNQNASNNVFNSSNNGINNAQEDENNFRSYKLHDKKFLQMYQLLNKGKHEVKKIKCFEFKKAGQDDCYQPQAHSLSPIKKQSFIFHRQISGGYKDVVFNINHKPAMFDTINIKVDQNNNKQSLDAFNQLRFCNTKVQQQNSEQMIAKQNFTNQKHLKKQFHSANHHSNSPVKRQGHYQKVPVINQYNPLETFTDIGIRATNPTPILAEEEI